MKILVWNINSVLPTLRNAVLKHGSWAAFFAEHGLDVACLQETKLIEEKLTKELCCVEGFQSFWAVSREKKGYSGVATYAADAFAPLSAEADCLGGGGGEDGDLDREGRVVVTDHGAFVLINVYVPNAGDRPARPRLAYKLRFLAALRAKADALAAAGRQVMLVGDFNIPAEPRDMHPGLGPYDSHYCEEERAALASLMQAYPDVWRRLHPEESSQYTVWDEKKSLRAFNQGLRIDYVLATPGLLGRVASCEILGAEVLPPKWSDHAGILLELSDSIPPLPPHPPCQAWKELHRRFNDTSQRSILSMFGGAQPRKRPAVEGARGEQGGAGGEQGGAAAAAAGGQQQQQQQPPPQQQQQQREQPQQEQQPQKKARLDEAAAADGSRPSSRQQAASGGGKGRGKAAQQKQAQPPAPGQRTIGSFFAGKQSGGK